MSRTKLKKHYFNLNDVLISDFPEMPPEQFAALKNDFPVKKLLFSRGDHWVSKTYYFFKLESLGYDLNKINSYCVINNIKDSECAAYSNPETIAQPEPESYTVVHPNGEWEELRMLNDETKRQEKIRMLREEMDKTPAEVVDDTNDLRPITHDSNVQNLKLEYVVEPGQVLAPQRELQEALNNEWVLTSEQVANLTRYAKSTVNSKASQNMAISNYKGYFDFMGFRLIRLNYYGPSGSSQWIVQEAE